MKTDYQQFKNIVMEYYGEYGRHDLPWRENQSPYYVLVSEIMLQQTQVDRVIPFFEKWIEKFPNTETLAKAKQSDVLRLWKGLGYNSRALRLQKCAQRVVSEHNGIIPADYKKLLNLSGIGPYTAAAVMNFAYNTWTPLIETNIRRVFIHHFFEGKSNVSDNEIMELVHNVSYMESPRIWTAALMDYGASLPKIIKHNPNRQSKHYTKQSKFAGSDRQIRGMILEILLEKKNGKMLQSLLFKKILKLTNTVIANRDEFSIYKKNLLGPKEAISGISNKGDINQDCRAPLAKTTNVCHSLEKGNPGFQEEKQRYKNIITKLITEGFIVKEKKSIILK